MRMAGEALNMPFWTQEDTGSLRINQGESNDVRGADPTLSSQQFTTSNSSVDRSTISQGYQLIQQGTQQSPVIQRAHRSPNVNSLSPHISSYQDPSTISQRPQLRTSAADETSSPIPIPGRSSAPYSAPAIYGHQSTVSPSAIDPPVIGVSPTWLSAGAKPLTISAPWFNQEEATMNQGLRGSFNGDGVSPSLGYSERSGGPNVDVGLFEMDPLAKAEAMRLTVPQTSVSTPQDASSMAAWAQLASANSQGAKQFPDTTWLYDFIESLENQSTVSGSTNRDFKLTAPGTSVESENGSAYHPSPVPSHYSPQRDRDMSARLLEANYANTQFPMAVSGTHLAGPPDPLLEQVVNPVYLPNISGKGKMQEIVPFGAGQRIAPVLRVHQSRTLPSSQRGLQSTAPFQASGMQRVSHSHRHITHPYQGSPSTGPSSSPFHRRSRSQASGSDGSNHGSMLSPTESNAYLSPQHYTGHSPSSHQLKSHSRTNSLNSAFSPPGLTSRSSPTGSSTQESGMGSFHSPHTAGSAISLASGFDGLQLGNPFSFGAPYTQSPAMHTLAEAAPEETPAGALQLHIPIVLPQPPPVPQLSPPVQFSTSVPSGQLWYPKLHQAKEGKLQIDHAMIAASFRDPRDPLSAQRRSVLERILQSIWFQSHELEPKVSGPYDELTGGLGVGGRSVYTCFLKFITAQEGTGTTGSGGKWVCLFGDEDHPCPKARWEEGFNKPERAIEHIRSHLGHRPFWCNNECGSNPPCTWKFFANSHRYDHWKKPHKRSHCEVCGESVQAQNLIRHLETHVREDA